MQPNREIEKRLAILETLMCDTREDLKEIKERISNEIPHQIDDLRKDLANYKLSNSKWLIGILVSLVFLLIGTLINLIK